MNEEIPDGLHPMQYGLHILEFSLGWPAKGNQELMADCLSSIMKTKGLTGKQAYKYMHRAISLAKEQAITIDGHWLRNGEYMNVRPAKTPTSTVNCDAECRSRHGRGYHTNDILWLFDRYTRKKDSLPERPMTDGEINTLLDELDRHRGRKPIWR